MAGIYLHIPFCSRRCVYCDFYFVTTRNDHGSFVNAMCREIELQAPSWSDEPIRTIYFGGGTPSLLLLSEVESLFNALNRHFDLKALEEVTFELNPEDVTPAYLDGLLERGINRLSIGIQAFDQVDLEFMGRSHTQEQAQGIIPMARWAGFENFSVDLIFGIPGQSTDTWMHNLNQLLDMNVPHISTYGLTVEPRTILGKWVEKKKVVPVPDKVMQERYSRTMDTLQTAGYEHYEISSFAQPGYRSVHNQIYWYHENYLGLGPSAHSLKYEDRPRRWSNVRNLRRYESRLSESELPIDHEEVLDKESEINEYIMLRLRTSNGIDLNTFKVRFGIDLGGEKQSQIDWMLNDGFITISEAGVLRLTDKGKAVCDSVTGRLFL